MQELTGQEVKKFFQCQQENINKLDNPVIFGLQTLTLEAVEDFYFDGNIHKSIPDMCAAIDRIRLDIKSMKGMCGSIIRNKFRHEMDLRLDFLNCLEKAWLNFNDEILSKSDSVNSSLKPQFLYKYNHESGKYEVWTENFKTLIKQFDKQDDAVLCQSMLNKVIE